MLSKINYQFFITINNILNIKTELLWSQDLQLVEGKTERLVDLCQKVGATEYISGPAAKDYLDVDQFLNNNIRVAWMDYSGYAEYRQLHPPFEQYVSVLDLIFNEGDNATSFMKSFNQ